MYGNVDTPCAVGWDEMKGDEQVRFCSLCNLNVYNLTEMTDGEAAKLLRDRPPGRLCVQMAKRADGSILTSNCPKFLRPIRNTLRRRTPWILTAILALSAQTAAHSQGGDAFAGNSDNPALAAPNLQGGGMGTIGGQYETGAVYAGSQNPVPVVPQPSWWAALAPLAAIMLALRETQAARRQAFALSRAGACLLDSRKFLVEKHKAIGVFLCIMAVLTYVFVQLL